MKLLFALVCLLLMMGRSSNAAPPVQQHEPLASAPGANAGNELIQNLAHNKVSTNLIRVLITGFLVMLAGFALVETGLCRAKSAAHVMSMNRMIHGLGMPGFRVCGFPEHCREDSGGGDGGTMEPQQLHAPRAILIIN